MLLTTIAGLFLGSWSLVLLFDHYMRTRNVGRYMKLVENTGLVVSPFYVRIYASGRFQRWLDKLNCLRSTRIKCLLDLWFLIGVVVSIACSLVMLYLLSGTLLTQINILLVWLGFKPANNVDFVVQSSTKDENVSFSEQNAKYAYSSNLDESNHFIKQSGIGIVPVIPGLNLPWSHTPFLFLVLVIAGVLHELGHAIAAANERVTVSGFGMFLLGVYPGAFTELQDDALYSIGPFRRLKIFCGGIWHNLATALLSLLFISCLPKLLNLGYTVDKGVIVTDVHASSGLRDIGGLQPGDVVYEINYCKVYNADSWAQCLQQMAKRNAGYCVPKLKMKQASKMTQRFQMDEHGELKCCQENATASHMCFYYKAGYSNLFNQTATARKETYSYSCLPARYVTDHYVCNYSHPCGGLQTVCVYPALFNNTKLFRFQLDVKRPPTTTSTNNNNNTMNNNAASSKENNALTYYINKNYYANQNNNNNKVPKRQPVLFIGHPKSVLDHVTVSSFVPRRYLHGNRLSFITPLWLPKFLDLFFRYLFTFSLAFALLNAVPCHTLDGQFIWSVLIGDSRCSLSSRKTPPVVPTSKNRTTNPKDDGVIIVDRQQQQQQRGVNFWTWFLYKSVMWYGTVVLMLVVLLGLFSFFVTSPNIVNS